MLEFLMGYRMFIRYGHLMFKIYKKGTKVAQYAKV
jgi:hypothetical protein